MECIPRVVENVMYTWLIFAVLGFMAMLTAETMGAKDALAVGRSASREIPYSTHLTYNLVLVAFTLALFVATLLLFCLGAHAAMCFVHMTMEAVFRDPKTGCLKYGLSAFVMRLCDNLLDPSMAFAFLGQRVWKVHAAVFVAVLFTGAVHSLIYLKPARDRARTIRAYAKEEEKANEGFDRYMVERTYLDTMTSVMVVMFVLYAVVVVRELTFTVAYG